MTDYIVRVTYKPSFNFRESRARFSNLSRMAGEHNALKRVGMGDEATIKFGDDKDRSRFIEAAKKLDYIDSIMSE